MSRDLRSGAYRMIDEAGIFPGMPEAVYHCDPVVHGSLSSTALRTLLLKTPKHALDYVRNGRADTDAFEYGRALHTEFLGVGQEIEVYSGVITKGDRKGQPVDSWATGPAQEFRKKVRAAGRIPLLAGQYGEIRAAVAELRAHPYVAKLLRRVEHYELTAVGQDPDTGEWIRGRLDFAPALDRPVGIILGDYKGLSRDTPIPTPAGWSTMGELTVGDTVFGSDGQPCRVTGKSDVHWRDCYRIKFDDGSTVVCDAEHLWMVTGTRDRPRYSRRYGVLSTEEIRHTLRPYRQAHYQVRTAGALVTSLADLPVDPYVLGAWLGDGDASGGVITGQDGWIFEEIARRGHVVRPSSSRRLAHRIEGLTAALRGLGVLGDKRVPAAYLRASAGQRLDLLRGLMDTDGTWNATRGQAVFVNTDKRLAEAVRELALSLGQRAVVLPYTARGFGLVRQAYFVQWRPTGGVIPFGLPRKAEAARAAAPPRTNRSTRRLIVAVDPIPTVPTQCIVVDSPDSTYLCTEAMIPTHNSKGRTASVEACQWATWEYRYDVQGVHMIRALQWAGAPVDPIATPFVLIYQEATRPYDVTVVELDETWMKRATKDHDTALRAWADCRASGRFPGYGGDDVVLIGQPRKAQYDPYTGEE